MKTLLFPHPVSADILYLFLLMFNILPEPIFHGRSYFHMFLILMCWQFNFPNRPSHTSPIMFIHALFMQNILIQAFSTEHYFLWSWHLADERPFKAEVTTAPLINWENIRSGNHMSTIRGCAGENLKTFPLREDAIESKKKIKWRNNVLSRALIKRRN